MKFRIWISIFFSVCTLTTQARAEEFYVELGRAASDAEAQARWQEIRPKHSFLEDYDVYPNPILQPDGSFIYRVQAGPMLTKKEAQEICARLFRRNISCFVIEGFDPQNEQTFISRNAPSAPVVTKQDFVLPWLQRPTQEPVFTQASKVITPEITFDKEVVVENGVFLPPLEESNPLSEPEKQKMREAVVDVAEAIPVPLTNDQLSQEVVNVGEGAAIFTVDGTTETSDVAPQKETQSGWLNIQPFLDEQRAQAFWGDLKRIAPDRAASLSMRMVRPIVSHDIPKVILSLGTFESEAAAMQFCKQAVEPSSPYLECQFSTTLPEGTNGAEASVANIFQEASQDENSLFWIEMLREKNQDKALERWERIRTDHDDLLADVRSQITSSFAEPGYYIVRIGPLNARSKASELCAALGKRKLACKVTSL